MVEIVTKEAAKSGGKTAAKSERLTVVTKGERHATLDIKGISDNQNPKSQPLYVVDGKVMEANSDISSVDVCPIESLNILTKSAYSIETDGLSHTGLSSIRFGRVLNHHYLNQFKFNLIFVLRIRENEQK